MADILTPAQRSARMAAIGSKNTAPELRVRRLLHAMGYRYRVHRRDLPGCPDIVFPAREKVIFVHGCFWHCHEGCRAGRIPASNTAFWAAKLASNRARDAAHLAALAELGWDSLVVWECETRTAEMMAARLQAFLGALGRAAHHGAAVGNRS